MCSKCNGVCSRAQCEKDKKVPHKHAELIKAWADNPKLIFQFRGGGLKSNCWYQMGTPDWSHSDIRIKPEPKPDVLSYSRMEALTGSYGTSKNQRAEHNILCIYDGETGKLKSVEMI